MNIEELKLMSVGTETMSVIHRFSPKQLDERRKMVTDLSIDLMVHDDEWKEARAAHDEIVKPIREQLANTIKEASRGFEEKKETVYLIPDQETGVMNFITEDGTVAHIRPLLPSEHQMSLISHMKEG
jgi:hypothetical protein